MCMEEKPLLWLSLTKYKEIILPWAWDFRFSTHHLFSYIKQTGFQKNRSHAHIIDVNQYSASFSYRTWHWKKKTHRILNCTTCENYLTRTRCKTHSCPLHPSLAYAGLDWEHGELQLRYLLPHALQALLNQLLNSNLRVLFCPHGTHSRDSTNLKLVLTGHSAYEITLDLTYFLRTKGLIFSPAETSTASSKLTVQKCTFTY